MSQGPRTSNSRLAVVVVCLVALVSASAASAGMVPTQGLPLTITRINAGGTGPSNKTGSGNLVTIFNAAADWWELAIGDTHTVAITYSWAGLGAGTLGQHQLTGQGGTPNRETTATIQFNNALGISFFLDTSPKFHTEYQSFATSSSNLGGGVINTGRVWTATNALSPAFGAWDLFSVALHEIGHALGLSSANRQYQDESWPDNDIDVLAPRPFAGTVIPTNNTGTGTRIPWSPPTSSNAHMRTGVAAIQNTLMVTSISNNIRHWGSALDILAMAELQDFNTLNLNPSFSIPEPGTFALLGIGLMGIVVGVRRRRKKAA